MPLTTDQVLALAPDPASAKAGSGLATLRKWARLGRDADGRMVWGECQGSGATPYQTQVDISELAFKCTCPSRKFPCKHAIALLLLLASDSARFDLTEWPQWVAEWAATREKRIEKRIEKRAAKQERADEDSTVDLAARTKRIAARTDRISAGFTELDLWLCDLVRGGIAGIESRPVAFFDTLAARLVDAQAPGVARIVRELATCFATGDGWHARLVARLGQLYLLTRAWSRFDTLTAESQADLRAHIGWTTTEADLSDVAGVEDTWIVIGQIVEDEDRLRVRRTWVRGCESARLALLLHFAVSNAPFTEFFPPAGETFRAELVFFPGSVAQRAFVRSRGESTSDDNSWPDGERQLANAVGVFADAIALDPWVERVPLLLDHVVPERSGNAWRVRDESGDTLPMSPLVQGWQLLAVSGGHPVSLSAEWTGEYLTPLAVKTERSLLSLSTA